MLTSRSWGGPLIGAILVLTAGGCGTIADFCYTNHPDRQERDRYFDNSGPHIYGGVQVDLHLGDPDYWGGHLAPVAARAGTHFVVTKDVSRGRTYSNLQEVRGKARQEEIARMLGGKSDSAMQLAASLLKGRD